MQCACMLKVVFCDSDIQSLCLSSAEKPSFANSFVPGQDRKIVGSDLDPICLALLSHGGQCLKFNHFYFTKIILKYAFLKDRNSNAFNKEKPPKFPAILHSGNIL